MKKFFQLFIALFLLCQFNFVQALEIANDGYIQVECEVEQEPGESSNSMRRIAILEGYRYLAEQVGDLRVNSSSTVNQYRLSNDEINVSVEKVLNGAQIVSVNKDSVGTYHVIVRLPVFGGANSLASAVLPQNKKVEKFPKPKFTNLESNNLSGKYTGLIIDCRGLSLSTAIAPAIESVDGTKLYSFKNVARDTAVKRGMVAYSDEIDSGVNRAGSNPLVVKAVDISSVCDVIVSQEDADRILVANQKSNFLNNCMVVIVR